MKEFKTPFIPMKGKGVKEYAPISKGSVLISEDSDYFVIYAGEKKLTLIACIEGKVQLQRVKEIIELKIDELKLREFDKKQGEELEIAQNKCRCGHARVFHGPSHDINFTQGMCHQCDCKNFLMD